MPGQGKASKDYGGIAHQHNSKCKAVEIMMGNSSITTGILALLVSNVPC
jgi:hypothetical protein